MIRYNAKGHMIYPCPNLDEGEESILVAEECYCPNGHNLVKDNADFNGFDGIVVKVENLDKTESGLIALSPICGDKSRITLDIELKKGEKYTMYCPDCDSKLPIYSDCTCGASLIALFCTNENDFADCICICNRYGCHKSYIKDSEEAYNTRKSESRWKS